MKRGSPSVALIWIYEGNNGPARLDQIASFDYPDFEIIEATKNAWAEALKSIPRRTDICVFWVDDDKPVGRDFLKHMTQPIVATNELRAVMHYWSGNALSISKDFLNGSSIGDNAAPLQSLLRLLLPVLDSAEKQPNGRVHVAFSSTERLAPLSMEPMGIPS